MSLTARVVSQPSTDGFRVGTITTSETSVSAVVTPSAGGSPTTFGPVSPSADGWACIVVTGLDDNVEYGISIQDQTSTEIGTATVTTLTETAQLGSFKIITGSCQRDGANPSIYNLMAAENADFFVQQGDLHYQDAQTEAEWRTGVEGNFSFATMDSFLGNIPLWYFYDNHDWGGNTSWRDSPCGTFIPPAYRELFGAQPAGLRDIYWTWVHKGVRFLTCDRWSSRDNRDDTDNDSKRMYSAQQENWLYDTLLSAEEDCIVYFTGFPLYSNWLGNSRWGDYRTQGERIWVWLNDHPSIRSKIIGIGSDSHNVAADNGANAMWGIPSLNASPFDRSTDPPPGTGISGNWNIANIPFDGSSNYSRVTFNRTESALEVTWEAVNETSGVVASYVRTISTGSGLNMYYKVGGQLLPVTSGVYKTGGQLLPITSGTYKTGG